MERSSRSYPGKILLFGEYTVLEGGRALAVPAHDYEGRWLLQANARPDPDLEALSRHLTASDLADVLDVEQFALEVRSGLQFRTNIPFGYGIGSSGALSAAVYDRYAPAGARDESIGAVRAILARIEACFHGTSSGIDPLVSYFASAVMKEGDAYQLVTLPEGSGRPRIDLVDSGIARNTASLVARFRSDMLSAPFSSMCRRQLMPAVDHATASLLLGQWDLLWEWICVISQLQYDHFGSFIPESVRGQWERMLTSSGKRMKLCGAGGGGFFLVFSRQVSEAHADVRG